MPDVVGVDTILEGDLPERAANYSSLATFAAKTETDWDDELRGAEETRWGDDGILGALFGGLVNVGSFVLSLLQTLAENIFSGVAFVFDTVGDALSELAANFAAWWDSVTRASSVGTVGTAGSLAGAVSGGVSLSDDFDRASADTPGGSYAQYSDGSGGGNYGPNGLGWCEWKLSGSLQRRHVFRRTTALTVDYQFVSCVISYMPRELFNTSQVYLCARMNAAATQPDLDCVYVRFGMSEIAFGYVIDGAYTDFAGSVTSKNLYSGDEIQFFVGTDTDDRQFICKVNGVTAVSYTDSADVSPLGGLYAGFGAVGVPYGLIQRKCGSLGVWAASDRLASAV